MVTDEGFSAFPFEEIGTHRVTDEFFSAFPFGEGAELARRMRYSTLPKKVVTTIQVTTFILQFHSTVIRAVAYTLNSPTAVCKPWANLARASLAEAISSAAADCCSAAADTLSISEAT